HCELGSENADDVTGSSIAVDAGGRRGFLRDTRLRAAIEAARAQFPDRREDMIDPLDVMAGKVRGEHPVRIHLRILPIASSRHENACEKFAQHLRLDANLLGTHGFKTKPATPPASTRTASLKSSMRIASCGLWLPFWLRTKIMAAGTPALAKVAASCPAPLAILMCAMRRSSAALLKRPIRSPSMAAGSLPVSAPSSNRTPCLSPISFACRWTDPCTRSSVGLEWLRTSRQRPTS